MSAMPNPMPTSQADKEMLLKLLRDSRECFLASFDNVSDEQSCRRPAEGSWSVLETVEHLTSAETIMSKLITSERRPRTPNAPNREEVFLQVVANRSRKLQSPEAAVPCGRFANLNEAAAQFKASRAGIIQFVQECPEDLRATEVTHPHPVAGVVSTFELIIIIAKHAERHALQIEEIKQGPAFRGLAAARG
ncbi:MAG TPA: DinB family protein [Candidatus Angelobacter sp.]|nr:DinB family protein [Candidatus Angelobacter sp.]